MNTKDSKLFRNYIYPSTYGDVKNRRHKKLKRKIKSRNKRKRLYDYNFIYVKGKPYFFMIRR